MGFSELGLVQITPIIKGLTKACGKYIEVSWGLQTKV